jgi:aldehyde dehydrogenase (NAD+)/betaine-aldehyde dehydrogenase
MEGYTSMIRREPVGVVGQVAPWNYPLMMMVWKIGPALAAGNTVVIKPAEDTPLSTYNFVEVLSEAAVPAGVVNIVAGLGEEAGAALASHPGIDHLSFTGSTEVGRLVGKAAAENVVPVTVELGGKSPHVVLADADLARAAPTIVKSIVQNAGQTCSAGSRVIVHEDVHGQLRDELAARFRALRLGPGLEDPDLGPLITETQRSRVAALVDAGRSQARLVTGGNAAAGAGFFFEPTLFDEVPPDAPLAQQEIFGPVLSLVPFADEHEAAALANATPYGLVAAVWTRDVGKAHELARELQAGQVFVNTYGAGGGVELPFGGRKLSGHGREKGFEGLLGFTRTKTVAISVG